MTGNEGRGLFALNNTIEPLCIEAALRAIGEKVDAVVTMGGEDLIVYTVTNAGRSSTTSRATVRLRLGRVLQDSSCAHGHESRGRLEGRAEAKGHAAVDSAARSS